MSKAQKSSSKANRYIQIIERIFLERYQEGAKEVFFERDDFVRHAKLLKIKLPKKQIIDTFLFENYERVDPDHSYGFNLFGEKKLNKVFTTSGGFADIHIRALNNDRFPPGKRFYFNGQMKMSPEFSLTLQFTQGVGPIAPNVPRTRLDIILSYSILETLRRYKIF